MKYSTFVSIILIFSLFVFSSCTKKNLDDKSKVEPLILRLAETHPKNYPTTRASQYFADLVESRTDGRILIKVFHSSQLGQEREVIEQVQFGGIDFTRVSIAPLTNYASLFNALQYPYLFRDSYHQWNVLNSDIGQMLMESLEDSGFVGLCWYDSGARCFYNNKKEIKSPKDFQGLKVRVQQSEMIMNMMNQLGAVTIAMAYGDVYTGFKTGTIDAAENNWPSYESTGHYEVAKYYTIDEHTRIPEITIASKLVMDKLSEKDQEIIKQSAKDSMTFQIIEWKKEERRAEKKVRDAGCIITEITDKRAFQKAMQPIFESQSKDVQNLILEIQDMK